LQFFFKAIGYFSSNNKDDDDFCEVKFLGFTLCPSIFPKQEFEYACAIQEYWNILLHKISNRPDILYKSLKECAIYLSLITLNPRKKKN
jgi:hypothetical protein